MRFSCTLSLLGVPGHSDMYLGAFLCLRRSNLDLVGSSLTARSTAPQENARICPDRNPHDGRAQLQVPSIPDDRLDTKSAKERQTDMMFSKERLMTESWDVCNEAFQVPDGVHVWSRAVEDCGERRGRQLPRP
mmetsp:Transcript_54016/g.105645  ORF Transcript_54016/g.105645 Transcript_54016/m.105645 type:complete len:133 (-) Transcript_54016:155-553(-)